MYFHQEQGRPDIPLGVGLCSNRTDILPNTASDAVYTYAHTDGRTATLQKVWQDVYL
jgi:hypothetical protein